MWLDIDFALRYIKHRLRATRNGHGVHSPFAYHLCEEVFYNREHYYDFRALNQLRQSLLADTREIKMEDLGAGSRRLGKIRRVKHIARYGISSQRQSEILYRLAAWQRPAHIIELGASLGLNTLYLAKGCPQARVSAIEGSESLCQFARSLAAQHVSNTEIIHGAFDDVLPGLIKSLSGDALIYIDGNHREDATIKYFEWCVARISANSIIVADDINWSAGMQRAWQRMASDPRVTLALDAFFTGYLFLRHDIHQKQYYRILT